MNHLCTALLLSAAASAAHAARPADQPCPPGQIPVMHVVSEGRLTYNLYVAVPQDVFPNLGISKVEEWLDSGRRSKSVTHTTFAEADDAGSIVWATVHYREVKSREVVLRLGSSIYEYDELGKQPGKRRTWDGLSAADGASPGSVLVSGMGGLITPSPVLGKAHYAGVDCNVHALPGIIANSKNGRTCVATLQGHHVVLAQDWVDGQTGIPQTMRATLVEVGKCVAETEFRPPPAISFTTKSVPSAKIKFRSGDEDDATDTQ